MGLLDLQTNLKSFKFGVPPATDRPEGGNSGEPYIKKTIDRNILPQSEDFLLRGGLNAPLDAATDIVRLTKFFADLKSPRGALFVAKQNILSRTGVATQASNIIDWKNAPLNEGVYTPLTTIAQAGVGFSGGHLPKQGLIPFKGVRTYLDAKSQVIDLPSGILKGNRLVTFYNKKVNEIDGSPILYSYSGGPNSDLGIGKTNIKFATNNKGAPLQTGVNNLKLLSTGFFATPSVQAAIGVGSTILGQTAPQPTLGGFDAFRGGSYTTINSTGKLNTSISDFREEIYNIKDQKISYVTGVAPNYKNKLKTLEGEQTSRVNQESPGQRGNIKNYEKGKIINGNNDGTGGRVSIVDRINYLPIYKSTTNRLSTEDGINDLVKFRIAAILRNGEKVYSHFRAFINTFSDAYNANWSGIKYMGRGEEFYKYGGFGRKLSLSYTVAAQSKPELMAQYKKLNFLASTLAPDYGSSGYMGGVLTTLTLGGWCYELPGFINSLNLEIPQESPWEIAIGSDVEKGSGDSSVKEMPHICNVSMEYTPIHRFRPELQNNTWDGEEVNTYGDQRYIGLTNGANNNYRSVSLSNAATPNSKQSVKGSGYS